MAVVRSYFHYLDAHGNLFSVNDIAGLIEGRNIPSGPVHLRDRAFLDFFYLGLRRTAVEDVAILSNADSDIGGGRLLLPDGTRTESQELVRHFPYMSVCGPERNFLKVEVTPLVFTGYIFGHPKCREQNGTLTFGEALCEPFQPHALTVTRDGKLLHPITKLKHLVTTKNDGTKVFPYGLVEVQIGEKLGLDFIDDNAEKGGHYVITWKDGKLRLPFVDKS